MCVNKMDVSRIYEAVVLLTCSTDGNSCVHSTVFECAFAPFFLLVVEARRLLS